MIQHTIGARVKRRDDSLSRSPESVLVVDTYNVLHTTGVLPPDLAGLDVPGLVRLLGESRFARRSTTLVCDGAASRGSGVKMGHVHVLFSGHDSEADDVIEGLIERFSHGRSLTIVSSDRRLRKAARKRGAESVRSADFLRMLVDDHGLGRAKVSGPPVFTTEIPLDVYSVDHWLREFGMPSRDRESASVVPDGLSAKSRLVQTATRNSPDPSIQSTPLGPPISQDRKKNATASTSSDRLGTPLIPPEILERLQTPPELVKTDAMDRSGPAPSAPGFVEEAPTPIEPASGVDIDPLLRAALEEWRGRLTLDDLDMSKWVDDVTINPRRGQP